MTIPDSQSLPIALRAYIRKPEQQSKITTSKSKRNYKPPTPSEWSIIFDTETTTDASQKLRFGTYQVRKGNSLIDEGVFYSHAGLSDDELQTLREYAKRRHLTCLTVEDFINKIFYGIGYDYRASIVGFNLPFDISRLAIDHATAKASPHNKIMKNGFSFKLSENPFQPRVQIKHVSSRDAFIQFAAPKGQRTTRGNRKKGRYQRVRRGFFIDIKTLAAALMSQSFSLASLAEALNVKAQKHHTEDHGAKLTTEYIDYARQDTQTTWECFERLHAMYELHGLNLTPAHSIHSEASLGKAYLRDMGVQPWMKVQNDFPDEFTGIIMSAYYGGRSEVHIRKEVTQVLYCDFLSMYPTVCTLMGLWRFVTAKGMDWNDITVETRRFLNDINVEDLQNQETWKSLTTLVQVSPEADIFPIRAKYGGDAQYTIGLNYLTSDEPLYYTLADCINSKLLTGRAPKIVKAISFTPRDKQDNLKPVCIAGNQDYMVDPNEGDFFKQVIDLRREVKKKMKTASPSEKSALENQQLALKILANATSYGIFVELNTEEEKHLQELLCYGYSGQPDIIEKKKFEATGAFFHPLLATLITGAARLMLGITEHLIIKAGLDWAFCDTDSMALAKPKDMNEGEFIKRAKTVQEWFTSLNPYAVEAPLLQIEDYNYSLSKNEELEPLYCYAISSKRYALFNIDKNGKVILRKVSAHGLGHLIAPYHKDSEGYLKDSQPWQQDFWLEIIKAGLEHRQPDYQTLQNFNNPAVSRYGATSPLLLQWFYDYNIDKHYSDQVTPFNFMFSLQATNEFKNLKPVAPFCKNPIDATDLCFDRLTGQKIDKTKLKTNLDALAQYHLHPETKFLNADFVDCGITHRRHIHASSIQQIGKEANKWEEQFFTGFDPDAQIEYGICGKLKNEMVTYVLNTIKLYGTKEMAIYSNFSERHILNINKSNNIPEKSLLRLYEASKAIEKNQLIQKDMLDLIVKTMKKDNISNIQLAKETKIDPSYLSKILNGKRKNEIIINALYAHIIINKKGGN